MIDAAAITSLLAEHLPHQRWYGGGDGGRADVELVSVEVLREGWPALCQVLVRAAVAGGRATYQVVVGLRPGPDTREAFLEGRPEAILGEVGTSFGPALAYDAALDPELALYLLAHIAPQEQVERVRPLGADQSNTSLVYDERLVLKLYRRLVEGPNPDVEVTRALAEAGFTNVAELVAEWRGPDSDYAVVNQFLVGASDGFSLAVTSLRDLYDRRCPPEEAGGDFGPEAGRLGAITAGMHLALAGAFGAVPGEPGAWADDMDAHLARVSLGPLDPAAVQAVYGRLRSTADAGTAIRVHGDFHLGQVVRTDAGWYILDFEGEPDRPIHERRSPSSPMRDVAGMARSFHYAAQVGLREQGGGVDDEIAELAVAWERHNTTAFVEGYLAKEGIDAVLPVAEADRELVRTAFELDKAVYELGYESAHRPDWATIPLAAVERLLEAAPSG
ncbi:MAG: maltokinase N-terminal cap-like domain-containing protein [Acidimicrobiales bacterium]